MSTYEMIQPTRRRIGIVPTARWACLCSMLLLTLRAGAFTTADADRIFSAYNQAYYFTQGTNGFYRATNSGGKTFFWDRAEQMEMVLDVYERSSNTTCLTIFSNLLNGFITDHGRLWTRNQFN